MLLGVVFLVHWRNLPGAGVVQEPVMPACGPGPECVWEIPVQTETPS